MILRNFDAANIVQQAFPEMSPSKITRDVIRLINDMSNKNLVLNDENKMNPMGNIGKVSQISVQNIDGRGNVNTTLTLFKARCLKS